MLVELRIKNFAIIEDLLLEFNPGLVVLTGETGAGKSIIMGALDLLLSQRVDMSTLRKGSDFASVEAVFSLPELLEESIRALLKREDLEEDGQYITLTRELRKDRRNTARVNGHRTSVSVLVEVGQQLVDIHGQSEHLSLLRVNQHLGLLDRFSGTQDLLGEYQVLYRSLRDTQNELLDLQQSEQDAESRRDLLSFQIQEIESAALIEGEDQNLAERRNRLANAEKLADLSQKILLLLDEAPGQQPTVRDLMGEVAEAVESLTKTDPALISLQDQTAELNEGVFDLGRAVRQYLETLEFNPEELESTQQRLALIEDLKRKYGASIPDVMEFSRTASRELEGITGRSARIQELEALEKDLKSKLANLGIALSRQRKSGADRLANSLEAQFTDLKMAGARFKVDFQTRPDPEGLPVAEDLQLAYYPNGLERVEFLVETNPGEGYKPLAKTASGGETARLMLALKNVLAQADHVPTLVFDEIDQGIGGRMGAVVGEKLFRLTPEHQVICITHLPQLAGFGQQHFQVLKSLSAGRTTIEVQEIKGRQRLTELATMLGGVSDRNLASARELLESITRVTG